MFKEIEYAGTKVNVSDQGIVIWNGKERNHYLNADGYPVVSVKTEKGWRAIGVARLVAIAFIPNPNNYSEVNHKNYDRADYSIENLEWISHAENIRYSKENYPDKHGENNPNYGNNKLHEFYQSNPEVAKEKQSRPGKQNGRYKHGRYVKEVV